MTPGLVFLAKSRNLTKILHELYTIGRSFDSVARITLLDNQLFSIFSGQATNIDLWSRFRCSEAQSKLHCYLRQERYVAFVLSACLLATSCKNYWWLLHENFIRDASVDDKELIKFCKSSESRSFQKDSSAAFFHILVPISAGTNRILAKIL